MRVRCSHSLPAVLGIALILAFLQNWEKYDSAVKRREDSLKEVLTYDMHKIKLSHIPEKMAGPVTRYMGAFIEDDVVEEK